MSRYSPDGKYLFYVRKEKNNDRGDIWYCERRDDKSHRPLFESKFDEDFPYPSPDGQYIAFQSDKSGQDEIYVTNFPQVDHLWQISFSGGRFPQWVGNEIFFVSPRANDLMAATIIPGHEFRSEAPRTLFSARAAQVNIQTFFTYKYAVTKGGKNIIASKDPSGDTKANWVLVENWFEEFRNRQ
jgi:hypothetical protein